MIFLFTDFSQDDIYAGQMHASIAGIAPGVPIIDLLHSAPSFNIRAGAYLLSALAETLPREAIVVAVVDPGVGGPRRALLLKVDGRWFIGPDNGLFNVLISRAAKVESYCIDWRPKSLSTSFHGRDLFAPVAARLAIGTRPECSSCDLTAPDPVEWPKVLCETIYIDHYGNVMTGIPGANLEDNAWLDISGQRIAYSRTFCEAVPGVPFWFRNSLQLVEVAASQSRACDALDLKIGDRVVPNRLI
ncbi:MAG: SAM-dependent chlorinase/fluorinase [Gammaproteobacteria bacterium]|nr:SAM-dependent chlorinase/fluorinase [Gammaproteobacteria bacterium]